MEGVEYEMAVDPTRFLALLYGALDLEPFKVSWASLLEIEELYWIAKNSRVQNFLESARKGYGLVAALHENLVGIYRYEEVRGLGGLFGHLRCGGRAGQ